MLTLLSGKSFSIWLALIGVTSTATAGTLVGSAVYLQFPTGQSGQLNGSGGGQVVGNSQVASSPGQAAVWNGSTGIAVDLNPSGFVASLANGTNGSQQVGYASTTASGNPYYAMLWNGTAASAVNLNPSGYTESQAYGTNGSQQVGFAVTNSNAHATLWNGTAGSAVDLNPSGIDVSVANATDGTHQVGYISQNGANNDVHATLWTGTATSAVDLNPGGFKVSFGLGTGGGQEVGSASNAPGSGAGPYFAMLWTGTAASAIDLNPSGFANSSAGATNGKQQVGYGILDGGGPQVALLWSGTAASAFDLQTLLPATGMWDNSSASSIDANGDIFGLATGNYNGHFGIFAVEWSVPEPSSLSLIGMAGFGLIARRRRGNTLNICQSRS